MNRSFALKKKIYLFFLLLISFFIFVYLFYFLVNGERGVISYYKIKNTNLEHQIVLSDLVKKNSILSDKIQRLQTNTIDLDFLDEKIREKTGYINQNEFLITFD